MDYALDFTEFGLKQSSFDLRLRLEGELALRLRLPEQSNAKKILSSLISGAGCTDRKMLPSQISLSTDNSGVRVCCA